ncbi:MAG: hypothetical protein ABIP68_09765 [Ferruginibacter sp.]
MRESRLSLLLIISLSILVLCFLALGIWGYQFYNRVDKIVMKPVIKKSDSLTQDSLLKIYTVTIKNLEEKLGTTYNNAGALEDTLNIRLDDYYKLKSEVSSMLTNPKSDEDFINANNKIQELQVAMDALRKTNANVTEENKRLYQILANMKSSANEVEKKSVVATTPKSLTPKKIVTSKFASNSLPYKSPEKQIVKSSTTTIIKDVPEKGKTKYEIISNSDVLISEIDLSKSKSNSTNNLELVGTFAVKSSSQNNKSTDIMVVVTQPDGKVVQKSNWESGSFNSQEGKKIYSCKFKIEGDLKETKKFKFTLPADQSIQGNYSIQLYNNGQRIGSSSTN